MERNSLGSYVKYKIQHLLAYLLMNTQNDWIIMFGCSKVKNIIKIPLEIILWQHCD
jgi:hypothetical protein